jgi:hypothetical protein
VPADQHTDYMARNDADRTLVRRLAALLRLADGLDADHLQVVEAATVVDQGDHLRLELRAPTRPTWTCGRPNATATCSSWSSAAASSQSLSRLPSHFA